MTIQTTNKFNFLLVKRKKYFHVCLREEKNSYGAVTPPPPASPYSSLKKKQNTDDISLLFGMMLRNGKKGNVSSRSMMYSRRLSLQQLQWTPKKYERLFQESFESQRIQAKFIDVLKEYYGVTQRFTK